MIYFTKGNKVYKWDLSVLLNRIIGPLVFSFGIAGCVVSILLQI